ncbi:MAG: hypothetical protein ACI8RE_002058 [Ilumatobacter sp.]|jgi:hypothetical protein
MKVSQIAEIFTRTGIAVNTARNDARLGLPGGVEPVECMPAERSSGVASPPAPPDIDSRKSVIVSSF